MKYQKLFFLLMLGSLLGCSTQHSELQFNSKKGNTSMVKLTTNHGIITIKLDAEKAPVTVQNFLRPNRLRPFPERSLTLQCPIHSRP